MKKITIVMVLIALGAINHSFSQVRKVTLTSIASLPGKIVAIHKDSTKSANDTFYTQVMYYTGANSTSEKIYTRIGGGIHYDTILLAPYVKYTFAVRASNDSTQMSQYESDTLQGMAKGFPSVQPIATTLITVIPIVNGLVLKHMESTVNTTDTFWSMPERSFNANFFPVLPSNRIKRIGGGVYYYDTIMFPLVNPGTTYWIRMNVGDSMFANKKSSGIQISTPLFPASDPTLSMGTITPTNNGGYYSHTWDPGYDSATITRSISLYPDSTFQYSWDSVWKVTSPGTDIMNITGLLSNKKIYIREKITNSKSSITLKSNWITSSEPSKAFIYKNTDSVIVGETTVDIYGRTITSGLSTTVKAINVSTVLGTESIVGVSGISIYHIKLINLTPNTSYTIKLRAENAKGSDSTTITFVTLVKNSTTFYVITDSLIRQSGTTKVHMYGRVNQISGSTAEAYGGLFINESCINALQASSARLSNFKDGSNNLYTEFDIDTNATTEIWGRFWGTDDKGRFDLTRAPQKLKVIFSKPVTGINDIDKDEKINVYPNPVTDILYISSDLSYEIFNYTGETVITGNSNNSNKIDMSNYPAGFYFIKIANKVMKIQKN